MRKSSTDQAARLVKDVEDRGAAVTKSGRTLIFSVGGKERKYKSSLSEIDSENLDAEFKTWGETYLWFSKLAILAKSQLEAWKSHSDIKLAALDAAVRRYLEKEGGGKKPTEKMVDQRLKTLPDYRKWEFERIRRREDYELASLARDALSNKKDLLLAYTRLRIAEMNSRLDISDKEEARAKKRYRKDEED